MKVTQGTETSKYLEEEKEKSIFLVAASEREEPKPETCFRGCGHDIKVEAIVTEENWKVPP